MTSGKNFGKSNGCLTSVRSIFGNRLKRGDCSILLKIKKLFCKTLISLAFKLEVNLKL